MTIVRIRAQVTEAHGHMLRAEAEVELTRKAWQSIRNGEPNPLALKMPERKEIRAELKAVKAALQRALLRRERTEIRVPFDSLIREKGWG